MNKAKPGVLGDHKKVGRRLVPPLLQALGDRHSPYSWAQELVPEMFWVWLLIDKYGLERAAELVVQVCCAAAEVATADPKPFFCTATSFENLTEGQKAETRSRLSERALADLNTALSTFFTLCDPTPLSFLFLPEYATSSSDDLSELLDQLYDRRGRATALTLATAVWSGLRQDRIRAVGDLLDKLIDDLNNIDDYPQTDASRAAAASLRAMAPMFLLARDDGAVTRSEAWLKQFWDRVARIGLCSTTMPVADVEPIPDDALGAMVFEFRNAARRELEARIDEWGFDLRQPEITEVVGGLLSRLTTLAREFAVAPLQWTPHMAPLVLRAMADAYIALAWILESDTQKRATRFVEDGLGVVKLEIAHRKAEAEKWPDGAAKKRQTDYVDFLEAWLASQRMDQMVEVNLGSWSGLSTREMATQAGCLDFYNYVYQPFSANVHSMWSHTSMFDTALCENPAHRGHRIARLIDLDTDPYWMVLAAKYLEKGFTLFDEKTGTRVVVPRALSVLAKWLSSKSGENLEETPETPLGS